MSALKNTSLSLFKRAETLLKIDVIYLIKGGFWTTLSFGIGTLGSLLTMVAFGNLLPREAYGTYSYLVSLGSSLAFLTLSGAGSAVMRAVARGAENVAPEAVRMQLKFNLLATATISAVGIYYFLKGNHIFGASLIVLAFANPVSEAFNTYKQILIGKKRFDLMTHLSSLSTAFGVAATLVTLFLTDNVLILVIVYALVALLPNFFSYRKSLSLLDTSEPKKEDLYEMRRTSYHITGAGIIGTLALYVDKIALFQVAGPASLAVYSFALAGPDRLKGLVKSWLAIALPRLAETSLSEIRKVFYKRLALIMLAGGILAGLYAIGAPYLFHIFLPKYLDSIQYSRWLVIVMIVSPASVYIGSVFASQNMLRATYVLSLGNHLLRIGLFLFCGWMWQIWGLVIAAIASAIINLIYGIVVWEIETRRLARKNG